ncbi:MAG: PH domain-containing protein [Alphaproteobacteria bacterium]|nr:PH domain-containing protein [Alphaproteobacteria bacterium]
MSEHDDMPIRGLPGPLPAGETLLWQGAPDWRHLALRVFHVGAVTIYFLALMLWRGVAASADGASFSQAVGAGLAMAPLLFGAVGILALIAWLMSRVTVYTITSKRIVVRHGLAFTKMINIPFKIVDTAALKMFADGSGDLAVRLKAPNKIAFMMLWPHARPFKLSNPEPTLRALAAPHAAAAAVRTAMEAMHGANDARDAHEAAGEPALAPA